MKYSLLIKAKIGALLGNKSSYYFFKCKIVKYRDDLSCGLLALNISVFLEMHVFQGQFYLLEFSMHTFPLTIAKSKTLSDTGVDFLHTGN